MTLPSARLLGHRLVAERTAAHVRAFPGAGRRGNAFLVSGTEVLFLPEEFPDLGAVTVYNGWFPGLSRPLSLLSAVAHGAVRLPGGRRALDALTRPLIGPPGGPDAVERAKTPTHVVAVAAASPGGAPLAEVHLEGPSIYTLTGELMAWAAHRLSTHADATPGVVSPTKAFGVDRLQRGCAEIGLTEAGQG